MDVLTDYLRTAGAVARTAAPLRVDPSWRAVGPSDEAAVYAVTEGGLRVDAGGGRKELAAGDAVVLAAGTAHRLAAAGSGPAAVVVGRIGFAAGADALGGLAVPPVSALRAGGEPDPGPAVRRLADEAGAARPGWEAVAAGLVMALFVDGLRAAGATDAADAGWLRGMADPEVGAALKLMHERPAHPWTVGELARAVAASRSAFAARFKAVTGRTPVAYLTGWRLYRAAARLRAGGVTAAEVARDAGYDTPAAFGKAFRRAFGKPPGAAKREGQAGAATPLQRELKKRNPFAVPEEEVAVNLVRTWAFLVAEGDHLLARHGLTGPGYNVLRILRGVGCPTPPAEVAARLVAPHPDLAGLLAGLAAAGLVAGSGAGVAITDRGRAVLADLDGPVVDLHRRQLAHLTPGELATLDRLLVKARRRDGVG